MDDGRLVGHEIPASRAGATRKEDRAVNGTSTRRQTVFHQRCDVDGAHHIRRPNQRLLDPLALDFTSSDKLLFASDHPWVDAAEILGTLERRSLPAETEARILGGNARRLSKL